VLPTAITARDKKILFFIQIVFIFLIGLRAAKVEKFVQSRYPEAVYNSLLLQAGSLLLCFGKFHVLKMT
jgi:hypothetical protein